MVILTDSAKEYMKKVAKEGNNQYVYLSVKGGGCSGFQYDWSLTNTKGFGPTINNILCIDDMAEMGQPDGHEEVPVVLPLAAQQARAKRADQAQPHFVAVHALDALPQEVRIEADLERLAGERHGHRLAPLAHLVAGGGHGQLALLERQAQR